MHPKFLAQWEAAEDELYTLAMLKSYFIPYQLQTTLKVGLDEASSRDRIAYKRVVADSVGEAVTELHNMLKMPHIVYLKGIIES